MAKDGTGFDADSAAKDWFNTNAGIDTDKVNIFSGINNGEPTKTTETPAKNKEQPDWAAPVEVGAGALTAYKNVLGRLVSPGRGVFDPINVTPKSVPLKPIGSPVTPELNIPTSPSVSPEPTVPSAVEAAGSNGVTDTERMLNSIKEDSLTGRQKVSGFNNETKRLADAAQESQKVFPGAKKLLVDFGPTATLESGIDVPKGISAQIDAERQLAADAAANQKASELARQKMAVEQGRAQQEAAKEAAKQKLAKEMNDAKIANENRLAAEKVAKEASVAEQRAAQQTADASAARMGKVLGVGSGALKVAAGGLGGFFAGKDFYDAYQELKNKGWTDEAIGHLISGVGGTAMMIPTPFTELGGLALQGVGAAYPWVAKQVRGTPSPLSKK
jgi:hypothetical protein